MTSTIVYDLPARAEPGAADRLYSFLALNRDKPVRIALPADFSPETSLLQILLVAATDWQARGLDFSITGTGARARTLFDLTGMTPHLPLAEVTQCH